MIEYDDAGQETGLLITETVNFLISRAKLAGPDAGAYDILWDNLPGLADGMDRDAQDRIWIALIKDRTDMITWMHANPWVKPLILRISAERLPVSGGTGFMVLSPKADEILAYSHHDGSRVRDLSVVVAVGDKLFLSSFFKDNVGLHYVPMDNIGLSTTQ